MWYNWKYPMINSAFTVIFISPIYRKRECVFICLHVCFLSGQQLWAVCCGILYSSSVLSVSPSPDIPVQTAGVQLPPVISALIPSLHTLQLLHTLKPHSGAERSSQTPKIAQQGVCVSEGGAECRPQQGPKESCAQPCPPITQTEGQERSQDPVNQLGHILLSGCTSRRLIVTCARCSWRGKSDWVWASSSWVAGRSRTMKLSVALFFAGLFGALAAVFILLSFGTDYWLLASESCRHNGSVGPDGVTIEVSVGLQTAADQFKSWM